MTKLLNSIFFPEVVKCILIPNDKKKALLSLEIMIPRFYVKEGDCFSARFVWLILHTRVWRKSEGLEFRLERFISKDDGIHCDERKCLAIKVDHKSYIKCID
jgi:hypothetical protein